MMVQSIDFNTEHPMSINILELSAMKREFLTDEYQIAIADIKCDLQTGVLNTKCNHEENTDYLIIIRDVVSKYPKITSFVSNKPLIPEFEEIEERADDNKDIKKMIRKTNYDFIGYSCNHKQFNKHHALITSKMIEIFESDEFKEYDRHMDNIARLVYNIQTTTDKVKNKVWPCKDDNKNDVIHLAYKTDGIIDIILLINKKIQSINAGICLECYCCKAAIKRYNYCKRLIEIMRVEASTRDNKIRTIINNPDQSFCRWMVDNYGSIERIPLADIKKAYKASFHKSVTMDTLSKLLTDTKIYRVSNVHHTFYANRITGQIEG